MTRQEAKELLPVITAWANGEEIQVRDFEYFEEAWKDFNEYHHPTNPCRPDFCNPKLRWRIKPKRREFWVVITRGSGEVALTCTTRVTSENFDPCLYNIWHCYGEVVTSASAQTPSTQSKPRPTT